MFIAWNLLELTGIAALFSGMTLIGYQLTKNPSEPTWLNVFCAIWPSAIITFIIALLLMMPSNAIEWSEAKELMQHDINENHIGILVENLTDSTNISEKKRIQELLNNYKFTQDYKEKVFDCTDSSAIVQEILKKNGYNAKLIYGADTRSVEASMWHMWVAVQDTNEHWILIETTKRPTIGSVIRYRPNDMSQYHYFQGGMLLNNSNEYAYYHKSDATKWNAQTAVAEV